MREYRPWTAIDDLDLAELAAQGLGNTEIAERMGRTRQVIHRHRCGKYDKVNPKYRRTVEDADFKIEIPDHVLADRDRRLAMQPRDLTALLMGDPVESRHGR